jgi:general secretion pathway protein L
LTLFPERFSEWLTDRGYKKLTLQAGPQSFVLELSSDRHRRLASVRIDRGVYSSTSIDDFLKHQNLDREGIVIGIRLPRDQIFTRQLALPVEAAGSIGEIVTQDLVAKTPFRLTDIYHDYQSRMIDGRMIVSQWIVRRDFVATVVESAGLNLTDVAFVQSEDDGGAHRVSAPVLTLQHGRNARHTWLRGTIYGLALGASLLAAIGCIHKYWRQERLLDNLRAELTTANTRALQVRTTLDKLDGMQTAIVRLRRQKQDAPGLLDVWEEVSRVLPANSWLTELRLSEIGQRQDQLVVMTGLSTGAAELVAIVDKSPLFADAALTAPIALDSMEQRERFTLQVKLQKKRPRPAP